MPIGLFSGGAAKATADATLEWQRLWMAQEEADRNYSLAQQQMTFAAGEADKERAFKKRLTDLQNTFQTGLVNRAEQFEVSKIGLEMMPGWSTDAQLQFFDDMKAMGSPLLASIQAQARRGLITNIDDAIGMMTNLFQAPPGTPMPPTSFLRESARAVITMMPEAEAKDFMTQVDSEIENRGREADQYKAANYDLVLASLADVQANTAKTVGETTHLDALTQRIFVDIGFDTDKHQFILDHLGAQSRLYQLEEVRAALLNEEQSIQNEYLPNMLMGGVRELYARVRGMDSANELFERTLETQIEHMHIATGIDREELRHKTAISIARDGIVRGELDQVRAAVALTNAQVGETEARAAMYGVQAEALGMDMTNARVQIATQLVELGRGDMLGQLASELFPDMPEDQRGELVTSLQKTASSRLSANEKMEMANVEIALAEADLRRQTADTFETQRVFGNTIATRAADTADRHVDSLFEQIRLGGESLALEWAGHELREWVAQNEVRLNDGRLDLDTMGENWRQQVAERELKLKDAWQRFQETSTTRGHDLEAERVGLSREDLELRRWATENEVRQADGRLDLDAMGEKWRAHVAEQELALKEAGQRFYEIATTRQLDQADTAAVLDRDRHIWAVESGEEQLLINWVQVNAYAASVAQAGRVTGAGPAPVTTADIHKGIRDGLMLNVEDLTTGNARYRELAGRYNAVQNASVVRMDPRTDEPMTDPQTGLPMQVADISVIVAEAERFGIDPNNYEPMALVHVVGQRLEQEMNTAQAVNNANTIAYIRAWIQISEVLPVAQDLGLHEDDPVWRYAMSRMPGLVFSSEAADAATVDAITSTGGLVLTQGTDGLLMGSARVMFDYLWEEHGERAMTVAGLHTPAEVWNLMDHTNVMFQSQVQLVNDATQHYGIWTAGRPFDVANEGQRATLETHLLNKQDACDTLQTMLGEVPRGGGFLGGKSGATMAQEQRFVSQVSNTLGIPLQTMAEAGLIKPDTQEIVDRSEFVLYLQRHQEQIAQQRIALHIVDGGYRVIQHGR